MNKITISRESSFVSLRHAMYCVAVAAVILFVSCAQPSTPDQVSVSYTVTFDGRDADAGPNPVTKSVSPPATSIDSLPSAPSKTGFTFGGWYTGINGSGSAFTASTAVGANVTVYAKWVVDMGMVSVPAGSYSLGSGTTFSVNAFSLSRYEVTQAQYMAVTGKSNPSYWFVSQHMKNYSAPVDKVSVYDAIVFCNMLSTLEGLTPVYRINGTTDPALWGAVPTEPNADWNTAFVIQSANGYRLPASEEWCWAIMGATSGKGYVSGPYTVGYLKEFAGDPNPETDDGESVMATYAWCPAAFKGSCIPQKVGTKLPNELGLYDMSGNVNEWCFSSRSTASAYSCSVYGGACDYNTSDGNGNVYRNILISASRVGTMTMHDSGFRVARN